MKTKLFSLVIVISAFGSIAAQTQPTLQTVTLHSFSPPVSFRLGPITRQPDVTRSSVNFETGRRGYLRNEDHTDFDLTYGGMEIQKDGKVYPDWLRVTDSRSMIVDLGVKRWQDFPATPPFPKPKKSAPPLPLTKRPLVIDASAGSKEFSPYRQFVEVKPGHMYLMRLVHGRKVIYTMFRVESLKSRENCVLSWKLVQPPNIDDNEK